MRTKLIGVKEFRQNLASFYAKALKNKWRYIVLKHNEPIREVRPLSKKEALLEKLAADIAVARKSVAEGKVYTLEEARRELGI